MGSSSDLDIRSTDGVLPHRMGSYLANSTNSFVHHEDVRASGRGPQASRPKWMLPYGEMSGAAATSRVGGCTVAGLRSGGLNW